ncbi:ras GTPase-activating protein raskol isoform X1 [Anopheles funestus]|uniref:ras GTPase-activating protein raskol isoform X1 n=2 Tax=Anopheles funestus TaxID=62324 RepID=UPI0020C6FDFF|nr:ras GTPase-activating protein raskol isoform X1 [Anopheles funestus]
MASDTSFSSSADSTRRRSTFYVPLTIASHQLSEGTVCKDGNIAADAPAAEKRTNHIEAETSTLDDIKHLSMESIYQPDLSVCSFGWSIDESCHENLEPVAGHSEHENKLKRYGVVLNASVNIDDDETKCHHQQQTPRHHQSNTSTPIRLGQSRSRNNILSSNLTNDSGITTAEPGTGRSGIIYGLMKSEPPVNDAVLAVKHKSKTLPQNMSLANSMPAKSSFLLHSTPRISSDSSFDAKNSGSIVGLSPEPTLPPAMTYMFSPKKSLSFIRRTHSTKLSRSNSLLKSLTSKCVDQSAANASLLQVPVKELEYGRLCRLLEQPLKLDQKIRDIFILCKDEKEEENAVHSDTSYEKACRRGSAPNTPVMGQKVESTSRFTNFFSKRSFRSIPLKRTKSVIKLDRSKRGQGGIRGSRSHESLLSNHTVMSTIDLSGIGMIEVVPVHSSVLGRRHCFQVRGIARGERYYSCGTRQERDLWIYSLRKSISPNKHTIRRLDNSLKMWIYEAKSLPPKKRYFCEIYLDKTLYGRTSVKLRADLLFWGEFFDFPDVPGANTITVNVFREADKKKKRDKHVLVGSVVIPIEKVTARTFTEDWYQIVMDKQDNIIKSTSKEPIPTLRIKCRYQSIDILPLVAYKDFQDFLKENYKKVCEAIEPIIGVKAKEDIGQALVLLMHSQGMAASFLSDVVALDLLRVDDQRLTFRGNSLATKSMEAFLKLIGEQYLQDTLSIPIAEIIASDRDCEVDPTKVNGSLSRQQQALRRAVKSVWTAILESSRTFPVQLRDCFATFRERLQDLNREDMVDNLISASIFLRFLCPAILSPSLFNITNELPSARATRNLTLVAKTLQTLANFTRFQGKENFMEFLNDFLEQEAPRMKQFLYDISCTDCNNEDNFLDWSGCIDQGRQLSILHSLLSEIVLKLSAEKQHEIHPLPAILESITKAKETHCTNAQTEEEQGCDGKLQYAHQQESYAAKTIGIGSNQLGTVSSTLCDKNLNIYKYNDYTAEAQNVLLVTKQNHSSNSSLAHSTGASNNSLVTSLKLLNGAPDKSGISSGTSNKYSFNHPQHSTSRMNIVGCTSLRTYSATATGAASGMMNNMATNSLRNEKDKTNNLQGDIRASTLPRYSNYTTSVSVGEKVFGGDKPIGLGREINENATPNAANCNLIQIDIDPSNPFNRKSPTPLMKNLSYSHYIASNWNQKGSQQSLLSPVSDHSDLEKNALNLGIPHTETSREQQYAQCTYTTAPQKPATVATISSYAPRRTTVTTNPSKMPMSLEDLEDLLNYADEQKQSTMGDCVSGRSASITGGVCESTSTNAKGLLGCNGSSVSIGQISNICSSGYQSIPNQSACSSPGELAGQQRIEYVANKAPPPRKLTTTLIGYNTGNGIDLCLNERSTTKAELPASSINLQLFKDRDQATTSHITDRREHEIPYKQSNPGRILNNNYVDSAYDVIPSFKSTLSGSAIVSTGHSPAKTNSRNVAPDTVEYFETNRTTNQQSRQKRNIMQGARNCGDSMHSESSSDERFSNTTSENYNEFDSLTTANVSSIERNPVSINNGNDYDPTATGLYGRRIGSNRMPRTNPLMQYKKDDNSSEVLGQAIGGNFGVGFQNGHRDHSFQNRHHRRLSLECARTLSDSSTDETESGNARTFNANHHSQQHHHTTTTSHHNNLRENENKRRRNPNKSVEQCEREIQRLQASLDSMRQKLEMSEPLEGNTDKLEAVAKHSDSKIRSIIGRLLTMEEELRQEQYKMSLVLSHKQRVIEAQGQQIAALDAANNRLLSALSTLQNRYESQSNQSDDTSSSHPNAGASSC